MNNNSVCIVCGKEFLSRISSSYRRRKTCSKECISKFRSDNNIRKGIGFSKEELKKALSITMSKEYREKRKIIGKSDKQMAVSRSNPARLALINKGRIKTEEEILKIKNSQKSSVKYQSNLKKMAEYNKGLKYIHYPHLGKCENNPTAKLWNLRSPKGIKYQFKNLKNFIRENPGLFNPEDVIWKKDRCKALYIQRLNPSCKDPRSSCKGWTWYSEEERIYNDSRDLLNRQISTSSTAS